MLRCTTSKFELTGHLSLDSPSAVYWQDSRRAWNSGSVASSPLPRDEKVGVNLSVTYTGDRIVWQGRKKRMRYKSENKGTD